MWGHSWLLLHAGFQSRTLSTSRPQFEALTTTLVHNDFSTQCILTCFKNMLLKIKNRKFTNTCIIKIYPNYMSVKWENFIISEEMSINLLFLKNTTSVVSSHLTFQNWNMEIAVQLQTCSRTLNLINKILFSCFHSCSLKTNREEGTARLYITIYTKTINLYNIYHASFLIIASLKRTYIL